LDGAPAAVRQTYVAAGAGSSTAMVRIGGCAAGLGEIDDGLRWFDAARRGGDPTAVELVRSLSEVRVVDRAVDRPLGWRWQTRSAMSRVWVWPGVLGPEPVPGVEEFYEPSFLVVTAQTEDALHAVISASGRMLRVTEDGQLLSFGDDVGGGKYTPNSDSIYLTDAGPGVAMDTKGFAGPEMGRTMAHILAEELEWSGVAALICRCPNDLDSLDYRPPDDWQSPRLPHDTAPRAVYIRRIVAADGHDGHDGRRALYRRQDGTWTTDRAEAEPFTEESLGRFARLAQDLNHLPDVDAVSLPDVPANPWPTQDRPRPP
jgi:hypothetical protein